MLPLLPPSSDSNPPLMMTDQDHHEHDLKYNLFSFATSELSHSAFWAWVLQNLDAPGSREVDEIKVVARRLLECIKVEKDPQKVKVSTEHILPGRLGRADIHVMLDDRDEVIIETKVTATPNADQLETYRQHQAAEGGAVHLAILTTAFDADVRELVAGNEGWKFIDMDRIETDLLKDDDFSHPLLRDYSRWLNAEIACRERIKSHCKSTDTDVLTCALRTRVGQWHLMSDLVEGMGGRQYRGTNVGGRPWTQFSFCNASADHDYDGLFYRIDIGSEGPYLSLRQYQWDPSPSVEAKRARLVRLQELWEDTWKERGEGLRPRWSRKGGRRGVKESEIGWFLLTEVPPAELRPLLAQVHRHFTEALRRDGWPVEMPTTEGTSDDSR